LGYAVAATKSLIRLDAGQIQSLLHELAFDYDEGMSQGDNLVACMEQLDWECVEQSSQTYSFVHHLDSPLDWDILKQMAKFLQDGSFFEECPGDYVLDLQGNSCPGVMCASIEGGVLHCRLYALVKDANGVRTQQLIEEIDPQLI